ncbi:MAG: aspartyl/asparaginyl beta-hydroxylase domain-containing protein [Luteimonas sp.]
MKLQVPFVQLPLQFDAQALAEEVGGIDEAAWRPHPQGFAGNSMLPLVAVDGNPANEAFSGRMQATPHLQRCPYLMQVFASLGVTIGRSRLMRLSGHAEVTRHADQGYYWAERVRVHVPIVTQPTVRFECGDSVINMAAGECWIFDTWRLHRVLNDAVESRIHLVVDTVGGGAFWDYVAQGRPHNAPRDGRWQPRLIMPQPGTTAPLAFEAFNVPTVMSPWELTAQFGLLFADAVPHPQLNQVQHLAMQLTRTWRGLWAQFGDSIEGRPQFRAAIEHFIADARVPAQPLMLRNDLRWYSAMMTLVGKAAVSDAAPQAVSDEYGMSDRA